MGGHWLITDKQKSLHIENTIYYNKWTLNTLRVAEAITILEVITMIAKKGRMITRCIIIVLNDNFKLVEMINNTLLLTQYTIEAVAEVAEIKAMIKLVVFTIIVK